MLKSFCVKNGLNYKHVRNCILSKMQSPPDALTEIMSKILEN